MAEAGASNVAIFQTLESCLLAEHSVKESLSENVRNLEQAARQIAALLQSIHQHSEQENLLSCQKSRQIFKEVRELYDNIAKKVPVGCYYKYLSQWQNVSNKLCFLVSLVIYLENGGLATREQVMGTLGVQVDRAKGFHIDLEEYLCGLLSLASELARLAVNSVIAGNYARPIAISKFVGELESGFRLLNLKNDFLRKKFDGLKYDVKKIEQVVYDLKIRGLIKDCEFQSAGKGKGGEG